MMLSTEEFIRRFASVEDGRILLNDGTRGECPLYDWDLNICRVYPCRPLHCRTYPFWASVTRTAGDWENEREFCPGIGNGELHSCERIRSALLEEQDSPFSAKDNEF